MSSTNQSRLQADAAERPKILILVVCYQAEAFIRGVLERIPDDVWTSGDYEPHVLVLDDESVDSTFELAAEVARLHAMRRITILRNPVNQGYGGNQKIGYHFAVENGYHSVVLLHGDGQYAPELLDAMIRPLLEDRADVVLGSRMLQRMGALRGGMPLYKWLGNQVLTLAQNRLLGTQLAEFHTGYRAYRVAALASVPFSANSDYYDFDTDILIQLIDTGRRIVELPIPTYYGEEISYVNGLRYGALVIRSTLQSRLVARGLFYDPKFDYNAQNEHYSLKVGYASSHEFALSRVERGTCVLDVGAGPGFMAQALRDAGTRVVSLDRHIQPLTAEHSTRVIQADAESYQWRAEDAEADTVLLLDIVEHLRDPERFMQRLHASFQGPPPPTVVVTTANIAFLPVRVGLLLGWFNYGKRGILDKDHHRLFTFGSLERLLRQAGFDIEHSEGIPAPFPLAIGSNALARLMLVVNRALIAIGKGLFSYQIAIVARARPSLARLLADAQTASTLDPALDAPAEAARAPVAMANGGSISGRRAGRTAP